MSAPGAALPVDRAARERIAGDLEATLFVEAGAGSGKTTALVERVTALVRSGVALDHVAAITFTEKAAAELRDRVRQRLERECETTKDPAGPDPVDADQVRAARCREALEQLDTAAIGTLHAFARRILAEHAIEAGLPPRVEVLDEVSSSLAFERRWVALRDRLLEDPALRRPLRLLFALGVKLNAVRALAAGFDDNWDLVAARVPDQAPEPRPVARLLGPALRALEDVCAHRRHCDDPTDKLCARLDQLEAYAAHLRGLDDEADLVEALLADGPARAPSFKAGKVGRAGSWTDIDVTRRAVAAAGDELAAVRDAIGQDCAHRLAPVLSAATLAAAERRRAAGALEFHDLLVMARSLLADGPHGAETRGRLHRRYQRILLDEFQDTDPIQIELAVRIAATDPRSADAGTLPWAEVDVAAGHLFVVGDPKQSIYRFRRADISLFLDAQRRYAADEHGGPVELTTNFRAAAPLIGWVNAVFERLFAAPPDVDVPVASQPAYLPLDAVRGAPPVGPPVAVIGRAEHPVGTRADDVRAAEAAEVAATVRQILADGWSVEHGRGGWRPARAGDITVLVPARTSLPFLEDELEAAGVAFRAESSSLVYASRAVRDLLMVLRAADDPSDYLRVVSALRTPLLGCGDDDLVRWRLDRRGTWNYLALPGGPPAEARTPTGGAFFPSGDDPTNDDRPLDDPVAAGLAYLRYLHDLRPWRAPSELLDLVARDRRAFELGVVEARPRDTWRRLRFVIDQARAWSEATGGGLRDYLTWVDQLRAEGARLSEAVLPEPDDDAVRIMTIHAAKGLEFPVTIVSGLSTVPQARAAAAQVVFPPGAAVGYRLGRHVRTLEWRQWAPIDEQMAADERIRLLYVAATRARDHLVVSLHRAARRADPEPSRRTNAEQLVAGMADDLDILPDAAQALATAAATPSAVLLAPLADYPVWAAERSQTLAAAGRPVAVAATALTDEGVVDGSDIDPGLEKRPRDLDLPPWLKGRYGTAVGRAVHGALQTVDLITGDGLDAAVAAQCEAEAIHDRADDVRRLARAALGSPSVREASRLPHWREVYAATPLPDGRLLEGYLDLLYRRHDGLVIVDYKTSSSADPDDLDRRTNGYRWQGQAYATTIAAATGEPVAAVVFVYLTPHGAVERHLDPPFQLDVKQKR